MRIRILLITFSLGLLTACGAGKPTETSLSALAAASKDFSKRHVLVTGTLRTFNDPRHYWIEDDRLNRVAITPSEELLSMVGETISVRGTFYYDQDEGRRIKVKELTRLPSSQD